MKSLAQKTGIVLTVLAAIGGIVSIVAWQTTDWTRVTFADLYLPMAPITALVITILAAAQTIRLAFPDFRHARLVDEAVAVVALLIAAWSGVQQVLAVPAPWDHWFRSTGISIGNVEFGAGMAVLTAITFAIAIAAVFLDRPDSPRASKASGLLTAMASVLPALSCLSHFAGFPLLYGHRTMALHTALAFSALTFGRLISGGPASSAWRRWFGAGDDPHDHAAAFNRRVQILSALAVVLVVGGTVGFLRSLTAERRSSAWREMEAVASIRAADVHAWRRERLGDGAVLQTMPAVVSAARDIEKNPGNEAARRTIAGALDSFRRAYGYDAAFAMDAAGRHILSVPESDPGPHPSLRGLEGRVRLSGPSATEGGSGSRLDLVTPIPVPGGRGLTLVLRMDPARALYPRLPRLSVQGPSPVTLLVRREGDDVVNLTDLPDQPGTALRARRPVREVLLPAARAVTGSPGVMEGLDHRLTPVVSASKPIPETDWFLIVSSPQSDIYRGLRDIALAAGLAGLLLIAVVGLAVAWFEREHEAARLGDELKAEKERAAVSERLALLMRSAHDLILVFDRKGRLVDFNDAVVSAYGYSPRELGLMYAWEFRADGSREAAGGHLQAMAGGNGIHFTSLHRRKDGSTFPVEVSAQVSDGGGGGEVLAICRDVTQRQAQQAQLHRLSRLYEALANVNEAVVRATGIDELLRASCRALAQSVGFRMVWVAAPAVGGHDVKAIASFGDDLGYLDSIRISTALVPEGMGPTGISIRENRTEARSNIPLDPAMSPWHAAAARVGYQSSISVPMRCPGGVRGALTAYSVEPDFFGREEVELLERAARDIGFGIESREQEAKRREAEEALRKISEAVEQCPVSIVVTDAGGAIEYVNPYFTRVTGYTLEEARGLNPRVLKSGETPPEEYAALWKTITEGGRWQGEFHNRRKDGSLFWERAIIAPVRDASGRIASFVAVKDDVTDRREAERALQQSEERLRLLTENATDVIWTADTEGHFTYVSPSVERRRGVKAADLIGRSMAEAMTADSAPLAMARFHELRHGVLAGERFTPFNLEVQQPRADGSPIWTEVNVSGLYDDDGRWMGIVGVNRDITERKRTEAKLAARIDELLHFQAAVIGREERIMDLKREVNALAKAQGRPAPYPVGADD